MRRSLFALSVAVLMANTFTGSATASHGDYGDGLLGCNSGEICFSRDDANTTYQKHFWYGDTHDGYTFTNVSTGAGGQGAVRDGADQIRNRDSSCSVRVIDVQFGFDDYQDVSNSGTWVSLISSVDNENDKHERC